MKRYLDITRQVFRLRTKGRKANLIRALVLGTQAQGMSALWIANRSKDARFHLSLRVY